jgi:hypothetical protein
MIIRQIIHIQRPPVKLLETKICIHKSSTLIDMCVGSAQDDEDFGVCSKCKDLIENDVYRNLDVND